MNALLKESPVLARAAISKYRLGPSLEESSRLGPPVGAAQRDRVPGLIEPGMRERVEQAGDTRAREKIFVPVLVVLSERDEDAAVRIIQGQAVHTGMTDSNPVPMP